MWRYCRYTFLDDWAAEAAAEGAVVLPALCGEPAALGPLQRLLDEHGVRSMGSGVTATETCADKAILMQQVGLYLWLHDGRLWRAQLAFRNSSD